MRKAALSVMLALALTGCMVGPDYKRPTVDTPQAWRFEDKEARDLTNTAWWEQFGDPVLNELIAAALQENKDIKVAAARVEQFAGQYKTTRAALFPQVAAGASGGRQKVSEKTGPVSTQNVPDPTFSTVEIFLNASWEIDFWGKIRRASEAARADLLSTEEARRAVILTLVSSVANSYINLCDLDKQLELTRKTAQGYKESYDIFKLRFQYGIVSEIEVSQAKFLYEQALSNIPFFEKAIAQQENAICVLLGRNPGPIPRGRTMDELILPAVPSGLPSSILENRPDIRQAEQDLVAANEQMIRILHRVRRVANSKLTVLLLGALNFLPADVGRRLGEIHVYLPGTDLDRLTAHVAKNRPLPLGPNDSHSFVHPRAT